MTKIDTIIEDIKTYRAYGTDHEIFECLIRTLKFLEDLRDESKTPSLQKNEELK
ncbi:MAG TPA: hypothetical protein VFM18_10680 [Methanosarcina sp.]|nr:hypothetical protein [Methanosarcina sp.]